MKGSRGILRESVAVRREQRLVNLEQAWPHGTSDSHGNCEAKEEGRQGKLSKKTVLCREELIRSGNVLRED